MPPSEESSAAPRAPAGRVVAAIPVRYASTRLPGKALLEIAGVPMVERVYRRAQAARGFSRVVVLTDDERIAGLVEGFGGEVEMTPADCRSGTERIASAAHRWPPAPIVNVQGDEPLIEPAALEHLAAHLEARPDDPVVTLATEAGPRDGADPNVVKVVVDSRGYALYFSRADIPYERLEPAASGRRHLGVYGYQHAALLEIAGREPTPLERTEGLEQLRMLETGMRIRVLTTGRAWPGVDTIEDLERIERLLAERPELASP